MTALHAAPPQVRAASPGRWRQHVNLARELALTQFKLKYTGSALGYLWSLLNPLAQFGVMYVVFVYLFHADRTSPRFTMQLLLGIVVWTFFSETTNTAINAVAGNGHIIRKAHFPLVIPVVASSLTALMSFGINFVIVVLLSLLLGESSIGVHTLLAPLLLVELYALILAVSLLLSSLFVYYRDIGHLWQISSLLLFYGSSVVFPFAVVPGRFLPKIIASNPVAQVIEDLRHVLISDDPRVPYAEEVLGGIAGAVPYLVVAVALALGVLTFARLSPHFAESL